MSYNLPNSMVFKKSPLINFKTTGNTTVFSTTAVQSFIVIGYIQLAVTATAPGGNAVAYNSQEQIPLTMITLKVMFLFYQLLRMNMLMYHISPQLL